MVFVKFKIEGHETHRSALEPSSENATKIMLVLNAAMFLSHDEDDVPGIHALFKSMPDLPP